MHQRAYIRCRIKPVADFQGGDARSKRFGERFQNTALDEDTVCSKAILTGRCKLGSHRHIDGPFNISIIENDQRCVTAKLHDEPLHRVRALGSNQLADFG